MAAPATIRVGESHGDTTTIAICAEESPVFSMKWNAVMAKHAPRFLKLVEESKQRVRETTVDDIKKRLDRGDRFALVDVREESEWAKGRLPGAIHLGKGIIERDVEATFPETG